MKKFMKQLLALSLALIVAFTFTPITTQAAGRKVTIASSGKVKVVMYKGARAKTATFSMSSSKNPDPYVLVDGRISKQSKSTASLPKIYKYDVTMTLNLPKMKGNDIVKTVQEIKKKKYAGKYYTYAPILIDSKGNRITDIRVDGGISAKDSSSKKRITTRRGRTFYYLSDWQKTKTFKFELYVPESKTDVNIGFAGLRNGQLKKKTYNKYTNSKIDYYAAGFGSTKKGFIIAGSIFQ